MWDAFIYLLAILGAALMAVVVPDTLLSSLFAGLAVAVFVGMCVNAFGGRRLREPVRKIKAERAKN